MPEAFYKQSLPPLGLSIERDTECTPDDKRYYVLQDGQMLGSFATLRAAQALYKQVIADSGFQPKPQDGSGKTASEMMTERYLEAKEFYWADSHKHRAGGGRGGRGGV